MRRWLLVLTLWPGIVFAQASPEALGEIRQELALIEAEIMALRALAANRDTGSTSSTVAGPLVLRLDRVEAEMRFLTGRMEALGNRVEVMTKNLDLRLGDIAFRVDELEAGGSEMIEEDAPESAEGEAPAAETAAAAPDAPQSPPAWTPPPRPSRGETAETAASIADPAPVEAAEPPAPKPVETPEETAVIAPPTSPATDNTASAPADTGTGTITPAPNTPTPEEVEIPEAGSLAIGESADFEAAIAAYQSGQPAVSALELTEFLQTYPGSPYATEALYFLALAERDLGRHRAAARSFLDTFTSNPSGNRAPASLLGVGKALGALGQTTEACRTIAEVRRRFPNDPAAADATTAAAALSCG